RVEYQVYDSHVALMQRDSCCHELAHGWVVRKSGLLYDFPTIAIKVDHAVYKRIAVILGQRRTRNCPYGLCGGRYVDTEIIETIGPRISDNPVKIGKVFRGAF